MKSHHQIKENEPVVNQHFTHVKLGQKSVHKRRLAIQTPNTQCCAIKGAPKQNPQQWRKSNRKGKSSRLTRCGQLYIDKQQCGSASWYLQLSVYTYF
jgi:rare lipoprotein A (peptidoglycan hydrolase)